MLICFSDHQCKLDFEVNDFFMFGSPLALVLAYRKISSADDKNSECCSNLYEQLMWSVLILKLKTLERSSLGF
jgi:hypothetical protein